MNFGAPQGASWVLQYRSLPAASPNGCPPRRPVVQSVSSALKLWAQRGAVRSGSTCAKPGNDLMSYDKLLSALFLP